MAPRRWTVGFVTGDTTGELSDKLGGVQLSIYVPTTPNPTSGYLIFYRPNRSKSST